MIGNILQTRKQRVVFVTPEESYEINLTREQIHHGIEIEDPIVQNIVDRHTEILNENPLTQTNNKK